MLAVHLENGRVTVRNLRRPKRPAGFALIRLLYGGICNTDIELQRGYYGFRGIPGHEFVGEVVEADTPTLVGKRVAGEINLACGRCEWCRKGLGRHCPKRTVLGIVRHPGAFREFLTLPEVNLHAIPDSVTAEEAAFIEPLAAACEILEQVRIPDGSDVAVLGDGKLGLLVAQALKARRMHVHLYGRHKAKQRIAERAGVDTSVVGKKLPQSAYDWIVDATGSADGLSQAVAMARPRGTIFMKSTIHGTTRLDAAPVIVNEITLVGSRCGRFEPAIELLRSHKVSVKEMVSDILPVSLAPRAFARAAEHGVLKVLLAR
jgi:threonine dehydrogenase-like Zn-dependent dehydrogenase